MEFHCDTCSPLACYYHSHCYLSYLAHEGTYCSGKLVQREPNEMNGFPSPESSQWYANLLIGVSKPRLSCSLASWF